MDMKTCMRPLTVSLQICGLYVPETRTGARRIIQLIYCTLMHILLWGSLARFSLVFMFEKGWSGSFMTYLSYFMNTLGVTYHSTVFLYASSIHLGELFKLFTEYQERYGLVSDLKKLNTVMRIACTLTILASFGQGFVAVSSLTLLKNTTLERLTFPFNTLQGVPRILFTVVLAVFNLQLFSVQLLPIILFSGICFCFSKEFDCVKKNMGELVQEGNVDGKCEMIRQQHITLCAVLEKANQIITHLLFYVYVTQIPVQCFILYGLIRGSLPLEEFTVALAVAMIGIVTCFSATIVAACLSSKAHGCLDDLLQANMTDLSPKTLQIISVFVCRLTGPPIGFTVYGLFTVDASTILTIIGTLLTYSVVVLQVKPDDSALAQIQATINALTNSTT